MAKKKPASPSGSESGQSMVDDERFAVADEVQDLDEDAMAEEEAGPSRPKTQIKKKKHGIIYISSIPKYMTVSILREFLSEHADIGRVYLQAANGQNASKDEHGDKTIKKKKRKLKYRTFTEGWIEFLSKKAAKVVAQQLNGKPITTRKKSKFCDILWNMKYLPRFKWMHLSERLTYEKMVYQQRMRNEIAQARREADYFGANLDKSEFKKKKKAAAALE